MDVLGIYLCLLNVILLSVLHNFCYMYLSVLGNFPLSLCIFTQYFFPRLDSTLLLTNLSMVKSIIIFIITLCLGSSATYLAFNSSA